MIFMIFLGGRNLLNSALRAHAGAQPARRGGRRAGLAAAAWVATILLFYVLLAA